jgi:hypothetical protein
MEVQNNYDIIRFLKSPIFRLIEIAFWIAFVLLPGINLWLAYDWLPNESFDKEKHELLESHLVDGPNNEVGEVADIWRDKKTGTVFSRADFLQHRKQEKWRTTTVQFFYGSVGCFAFAIIRRYRNDRLFFEAFGQAMLVNLAFAAFRWLESSEIR